VKRLILLGMIVFALSGCSGGEKSSSLSGASLVPSYYFSVTKSGSINNDNIYIGDSNSNSGQIAKICFNLSEYDSIVPKSVIFRMTLSSKTSSIGVGNVLFYYYGTDLNILKTYNYTRPNTNSGTFATPSSTLKEIAVDITNLIDGDFETRIFITLFCAIETDNDNLSDWYNFENPRLSITY
jgi:hypothetical protein